MAKDAPEDEPLSRAARLWMLLFGVWSFPKVCRREVGLDGRKPAAKLANAFRRSAYWSLAFNALLLFRAYVSCALTVTGTKMDLVNTDVQVIVDALLPPTSGTSLAWSWLQAQIAAQGLFAFYYKLAKHAEQLGERPVRR